MLKNVDLSLSMSKEEYKSRIDDLYIRIGELQRKSLEDEDTDHHSV